MGIRDVGAEDALQRARRAVESFRPMVEARILRWLDQHPALRDDRAARGVPTTSEFCVAACFGLIPVLASEVPEARWRFAGGPFGGNAGGMVGVDGSMHGHFWAEGALPGGAVIVADVTADQFGHAPSIAVLAPDPRYSDALPRGFPWRRVGSDAEAAFGLHAELDWRDARAPAPDPVAPGTLDDEIVDSSPYRP